MRITDYSEMPGWQDGCNAAVLDYRAGKAPDALAWILDGDMPAEAQDYFILAYKAKWDSLGGTHAGA